MSLVRTSTRITTRLIPLRGAGSAPGPVDPRSGEYPYRHKELGGFTVHPGQGPYSIIEGLKGNQPWVNHVFKPEVYSGAVYRRTIDPDKHFYNNDRYKVFKWYEFLHMVFLTMWNARFTYLFVSVVPLIFAAMNICDHRREPLELFMDRDEFFKNYDLFYNGLSLDHHKFAHTLAQRRANKWGYHNADLAHGHH